MLKIGHALFKGYSVDVGKMRETAAAILNLHKKGHRIIVIAGGGEISRNYIDAARKLGADLATCDEMGIRVAKLNAFLLSTALGEASDRDIIESFQDLEEKLSIVGDKILVGGGFTPAQSTDAVAALIAERIRADIFIKTTDVDGVYDSDPEKNPNAKMLKEVSISRLRKILGEESVPGRYRLLDVVSLRIIERSKIPTVIINGSNPINIIKAVLGEKIGTRITC